MHYDGTICIQRNKNVKYLKEVSRTMDYLKAQSKYNELTKEINETTKALISTYNSSMMASFSNIGTLLKNSISYWRVKSFMEKNRAVLEDKRQIQYDKDRSLFF